MKRFVFLFSIVIAAFGCTDDNSSPLSSETFAAGKALTGTTVSEKLSENPRRAASRIVKRPSHRAFFIGRDALDPRPFS